jgi:hypothetical protein
MLLEGLEAFAIVPTTPPSVAGGRVKVQHAKSGVSMP